MNIFNAIKFPIRLPLTGYQLRQLPAKLYRSWADWVVRKEAAESRNSRAFYHPDAFAAYFNNIHEEYQSEYATELRKRILEVEI